LGVLGFETDAQIALVVMGIAAGAMTVSHANDSYFWDVTRFGNLTVEQGYRTHTVTTAVMGITSIIFVWLLGLVARRVRPPEQPRTFCCARRPITGPWTPPGQRTRWLTGFAGPHRKPAARPSP